MNEAERADACNQAIKDAGLDRKLTIIPEGYEQEETNSGYSNYCKLDSRTDAATLISFDSLKHVTKEGNVEAGAILIEICEEEHWLPKRLCSNLDLEEGTVYVWTKFLADAKPELLEMIDDSNN